MYIYLNPFISGCSGGLSIGSLLVGSQQVGPECSSSTASMHQPPNQDKVPCLRLESSTRDITLLSKTWLMYKTIELCSPHIFLTRFWHICPDQATPVGTVISGSVTFPITTWIMWLISMGRRLCRTCVLLRNLQCNHCFSKMTSVLTGMHGTRRGR